MPEWLKPLLGFVTFGVSEVIDNTIGAAEREKTRRAQIEAQREADREARRPKFIPMSAPDVGSMPSRMLDPGSSPGVGNQSAIRMQALRDDRFGRYS